MRQQRQAARGCDSTAAQLCCSAVDEPAPQPCQPHASDSAAPAAVISPAAAGAAGPGGAGGGSASWGDLRGSAQRSVQAGQHQAAMDACTALLQQWAPSLCLTGGHALVGATGAPGLQAVLEVPGVAERPQELAEVLALRAECHWHMGGLKQVCAGFQATGPMSLARSAGQEVMQQRTSIVPGSLAWELLPPC